MSVFLSAETHSPIFSHVSSHWGNSKEAVWNFFLEILLYFMMLIDQVIRKGTSYLDSYLAHGGLDFPSKILQKKLVVFKFACILAFTVDMNKITIWRCIGGGIWYLRDKWKDKITLWDAFNSRFLMSIDVFFFHSRFLDTKFSSIQTFLEVLKYDYSLLTFREERNFVSAASFREAMQPCFWLCFSIIQISTKKFVMSGPFFL